MLRIDTHRDTHVSSQCLGRSLVQVWTHEKQLETSLSTKLCKMLSTAKHTPRHSRNTGLTTIHVSKGSMPEWGGWYMRHRKEAIHKLSGFVLAQTFNLWYSRVVMFRIAWILKLSNITLHCTPCYFIMFIFFLNSQGKWFNALWLF